MIDLRPSLDDQTDRELRRLMIGRLERWSLAEPDGPGRWIVAENTERALNELGARRDTTTIMHRALKEQGIERSIVDYEIHGSDHRPAVTGPLGRQGDARRADRGSLRRD